MRKHLLVPILLLASLSALSALNSDELSAMMKANNLDVRKAQTAYRSSLLDVKDAKAGLGPSIDLTISGTYLYNPPIGPIKVSTQNILQQLSNQNIDISAFQSTPDAYLKLYGGMENTNYMFSLTITQPLVTWGKITNAIKLYEKVSDVRLAQVTSTIRQNESGLLGLEDAIFYLKQMKTLLDESEKTASRLVEITTSLRDNGLILDEDLLKVKIQAQQIAVGRREVEMQIQSQVQAIRDFCNNPDITVDMIDHVPDDEAMEAFLAQGQEVLLARACSGASDNLHLLSLMEDVADLTKTISSASVNWKPDIALQASLGYGGSRFPLIETDWYRQDDTTMNFTIAVKSTIWDGGKKVRDVKRSKDKVETAQIDYDTAVQKIGSQVVTSLLAIGLDNDKIEYQNLKIESDGKDIEQKKELFESGYGSETDYLQAVLTRQNDTMDKVKLQLDKAAHYRTISYLAGE